MKKSLLSIRFKQTVHLVMLWICLYAMPALATEEIQKKLTESFQVTPTEKLRIENRYGKVHVETGNTNRIEVNITVRAWGDTEKVAQKLMETIQVVQKRSGNEISFVTEISARNIYIGKSSGFEINYHINMPISNPLNLRNSYGQVYLADFNGPLQLSVAYGRLQARRITGDNSSINVSYGGAEIEELSSGSLESKYSKPVRIEKAGTLKLDEKYGGVEIGEIASLECSSAYSSLKIGRVSNSLVLNTRYGGAEIKEVSAGFKTLKIEGSYGSVDVHFNNQAGFDFAVNTRYGNFKNGIEGASIRKRIVENTKSEVEGSTGSGGGNVNVSVSYGNVRFY